MRRELNSRTDARPHPSSAGEGKRGGPQRNQQRRQWMEDEGGGGGGDGKRGMRCLRNADRRQRSVVDRKISPCDSSHVLTRDPPPLSKSKPTKSESRFRWAFRVMNWDTYCCDLKSHWVEFPAQTLNVEFVSEPTRTTSAGFWQEKRCCPTKLTGCLILRALCGGKCLRRVVRFQSDFECFGNQCRERPIEVLYLPHISLRACKKSCILLTVRDAEWPDQALPLAEALWVSEGDLSHLDWPMTSRGRCNDRCKSSRQ